MNYHNEYLKYKKRYISSKYMIGGHYNIDTCLTALTVDSKRLIDEFTPVFDKYKDDLILLIKDYQFNSNVRHIIDIIKENAVKPKPNITKIDIINNPFATYVKYIDLEKFREAESNGSNAVNTYSNMTFPFEFFSTMEGFNLYLDYFDIDETTRNQILDAAKEIGFGKFKFEKRVKTEPELLKNLMKNNKYYDLLVTNNYKLKTIPPDVSLNEEPLLKVINGNTYTITYNWLVLEKTPFKKYTDFAFIGSDIIESLQKSPEMIDKLQIIQSDNNHDNNLIIPATISNPENLVSEVKMHKNIVSSVARELNATFKNLDVFLLLSDSLKLFPKRDNAIFTAKSINSAEYSMNLNQLNIFRTEELSKLLFHELSHRAALERYINNNELNNKFKEKWAIERSSDLYFTESIIEAIAEFINIVVASKFCQEDVDTLWQYEIMFGLYQTAKILYISGFSNNREFINKNNSELRVKESTSAAEYHIWKTICMIKFNDMYESCFNDDINKINNFWLEVCEFSSENNMYNKILDGLIKEFDNTDKNSLLFETGRMSLIERDIIIKLI